MADYSFDQFTQDILGSISAAADSVSEAAGEVAADVTRQRGFNRIGNDLFASGTVTSHGGNLSVSDGQQIWITRTHSQLGHIVPGDIIKVGWEASDADVSASMELKVHRAVYHALAELLGQEGKPLATAAIVHAHGLHTTYHSLISDSILPLDAEGVSVLGASIPVLTPAEAIASDEVAAQMAALVRHGGRLAAIRGHGCFALAENLENAYRLVSCLEYSASLLTLVMQGGTGTLR